MLNPEKTLGDLRQVIAEIFNLNHHAAHDIKHVFRVANLAKFIAVCEGYDETEAEIAALLHDIGRTVQQEEKGHGPAGVPLASELLDRYTNYDNLTKSRILLAVEHHSNLDTIGALTHIVQDADMLDGMGAVGLMRAYMTKTNVDDYDPKSIIPTKGIKGTSAHNQIAYQMEWLELMHTDTARLLARKRYDFMTKFLKEFKEEVEGGDFFGGKDVDCLIAADSKCKRSR